jgi:hypothetical protein
MMSPDIQTSGTQPRIAETKDHLRAELNSSYESMIKQKIEIIKNEIVAYPSVKNEQVYSIGLGFALAILNQ